METKDKPTLAGKKAATPHSFAWELIPENVEAALKHLGLKRGVNVYHCHYGGKKDSLIGGYLCLNEYGEHTVQVDSNLRSDNASRVLWHELTHALQLERLGGEEQFDALYNEQWEAAELDLVEQGRYKSKRAMPLDQYFGIPLEAECIHMEQADKLLRLCRKSKGPESFYRERKLYGPPGANRPRK